nr:23S rRNA (adenine(2503)-C(2))-methyltransferase RlmN [Desulfonatronovibrio hydrogenovorans]
MKNILDLDPVGAAGLMESLGEPAYRADQVMKWIWAGGVTSFEFMTNVSKALRSKLGLEYRIFHPRVSRAETSTDGTVKFLMTMDDEKVVETVLIPAGTHYTQCLSTQVGCPMGCRFCSTGKMGFERNLTCGEIAGQVVSAVRFLKDQGDPLAVSNLVIMGMGEPLLNWTEVQKALNIFRHAQALNFSRRRITLSTVGVRGRLMDFGRSNLALPAISLHAPDQSLRKSLMPGAAEYELGALMDDLKSYPLAPRERITMEYVMLKGVNDSPSQARDLVRLLSGLKCKINLLRYNPGEGAGFKCSSEESIAAFQDYLRSKDFTVMLRKSMGADIHAACGQLKARCSSES